MSEYQRVEVRDGKERYGRLIFVEVLSKKDFDDMTAWAKSNPAERPEWFDLLNALCHQQNRVGWWCPDRFQTKPCTIEVPASQKLDPAGLGWDAVAQLRPYQEAILDWIDHGPVQTNLRESREQRQRYYPNSPEISPFLDRKGKDNTKCIEKFDANGIQIRAEDCDALLQSKSFLIYNAKNESYLSMQNNWKGLNQARIFQDLAFANTFVDETRDPLLQVVEVLIRVERFMKPDVVGPKTKQALSLRDAETLTQTTHETAQAHRSPGRRRL